MPCRSTGAAPTPPHQDEYFLRKSKRAWIVWIPLHDCPLRVGPLGLLPGSLHEGVQPHTENRILNLADSVCWATGPMRTGDVLMFDSHTIHCACPNLITHTTRFSIDCHYASRA
jgi:ectoine hydroxylase-related dioxygenase (phytanoyl-CoA dioxygenase family)